MGRRCLRLCNASLKWATVRCCGSGSVAPYQRSCWPGLHCNRFLQSAMRRASTMNLLNVPTEVDISSPLTSCMRGSHYAIHVRGYAVLPVVDIRCLGLLCHAVSHQYRVIKLNSPKGAMVGYQASIITCSQYRGTRWTMASW